MEQPRVAVFALLVGLVLVVSPLLLFPHAGQQACGNHVEPAGDVPADAEVVPYSALSPDAQRAFDRALADEDGYATVYGDRCPSEFRYTDYVGRYFVEKGGTTYVLETYGEGGFLPVDLVLSGAFVVTGLVLLAAGAVSLRDPAATFPAALGVLGLVAIALAVLNAETAAVLSWTALLLVVAFGGAGYALRPRVALGIALAATVLVLVGFGVLRWRGSIAILGLFPLGMTALGIALRAAADRLGGGGRGPEEA